jgi:hypothetical protein
MDDVNPRVPAKKPYSAPQVRRVELRPDEAVLGMCKTPGTTGPGGPDCNMAIIACSTLGS